MDYIVGGLREAIGMIFSFNREFLEIVSVSIKVSFISVTLATIAGVPLGIFVVQKRFLGKEAVVTTLNTLMSLPTVVVGLTVYSMLSRKGPLGELGLLYTLAAMVIGQFILATPIVSGLTIASIKGLDKRIGPTIASLGANPMQEFFMFLHEARFGIMAAVIAGFGRVFAEVGISMMLGGNIKGYTRNITTAIALETSKGEFTLGIALGIILLAVALAINILFSYFQRKVK
jgi:tungstate transport system permease protein